MIKPKTKQVYANYTDLKTFFDEETLKQFFPKPDMLVKKDDGKELWLYFANRVKNQILKHKIPVVISTDFQFLHKKLLNIVKDTVEEAVNGIYKEPIKKTEKKYPAKSNIPFKTKQKQTAEKTNFAANQRMLAEKRLEELSGDKPNKITFKRKVV